MPYAISGLLSQMEETRRRMQAPLGAPPDAFQLPQQGGPPAPTSAPAMSPPLAPPASPFANIANANISDANDPTHGHKRGIKGLLPHLLGTDRVPKELQALLTPDQIKRVKPGVVGSLWNAINYGVGPQTVMQKRAANMVGLQDEKAGRDEAATLKEQMNALRQKHAGGDFRAFAADLAMLRPELAGPLSGMVNAQDEPEQKAPSPIPNMSWIPDGKGGYKQLAQQGQYEERAENGGVAVYENGQFSKWKIRPPQERDSSIADSLNAQRGFQRATSLQGDYANDPTVKTAKAYASAYQGVVAASAKDNPQSNLALMYEAVKMRDPNAVREGELALQKSARSVPGWMYAMWTKAEEGNVLTPIERQQIVAWAGEKIKEQQRLVTPIQRRFGEAAQRYGVSPDSSFIAPSPFEGVAIDVSGAKKKLSTSDLAKAKMDPKFAAWAKANGYEVP